MKTRKFFINFFICFFIFYYLGLLLSFLNTSFDFYLIDDFFSATGNFIAFGIIIYGLLKNHIPEKKIWSLIAVVIFLNIVGDIIWDINELLLKREMTDVSICDFFYLPASFILLFAVFISIKNKVFIIILKSEWILVS